MLYTAATLSDPRRIGKEKFLAEARSSLSLTSSAFTAISCRRFVAQSLWNLRSTLSSSRERKDLVVQKFSNVVSPRSADSVRTCPDRSGSEKSGAVRGTNSQVSTWVGSNSASCAASAENATRFFASVLNGSRREGSAPSSTQIL